MRRVGSAEAEAKLKAMCAGGGHFDEKDLLALAKKAMYPTDHVYACVYNWCKSRNVAIVGAPIEANWQMVYMSKLGLVDFVLTADSDILVQGASMIVTDLEMKKNRLLGGTV